MGSKDDKPALRKGKDVLQDTLRADRIEVGRDLIQQDDLLVRIQGLAETESFLLSFAQLLALLL